MRKTSFSHRGQEFTVSFKEVDPKILRQVDAAAARNTATASLVSLAVFAITVFSSGLYQSLDGLVVGYAVLMVVVAGFRLFLSLRFRTLYGSGPARWRQHFAIGLMCHAILWGSFLPITFILGGMGYGFFLSLLYVLGVSTALAGAWMSGLRYRLAYLVIILAPTAVALVFLGDWQAAVIGVVIAIYAVYLASLYKSFYHTFWHAVIRQKRHDSQTVQDDNAVDNETQLQILSRISQDLRSPLNSLLGMLELLDETELDREQHEYHLVATQSGRLMLMQLNNVLDYSQILLGKISFSPDDFLLRNKLEQSLDAYGSIAQRQGLELSAVFDSRLPRRVRGDEQRIIQVLNGLLAHAIKHAEEGEVTVEVNFDEDSVYDGTLTAEITFHNEGLTSEQIEKLFEQQWSQEALDNVTTQSGFNLLVCRGLIEAMGGSLFINSTEAHSEVGFRLPLPARPDMSERSEWRRTLRGKQFVLVGSAAGMDTSVALELHTLDITTESCRQYDDALQVLRDAARDNDNRDVVIIDLWQSKEYALRLCDSILDDPSLDGCHILLLGSVEQVGLEKVLRRSEHDRVKVLAKPVHRSSIRRVLAELYGLQSLIIEDDNFAELEDEKQRRKGFKLLLVDDNEADQSVTIAMLDRLGYNVKTVADVEQANNILAKERLDLVFTELFLQGRSVFEWVKELRLKEDESQLKRMPVIALTGDTTEGIQSKSLAAGIDDYIAKPLTMEQLDIVLRYWLPTPAEEEEQEQ